MFTYDIYWYPRILGIVMSPLMDCGIGREKILPVFVLYTQMWWNMNKYPGKYCRVVLKCVSDNY